MKIGEFARENGVRERTLRYYDEIGLLCPSSVGLENSYREYAPEDAQRLQAIRFYQLLGFGLQEISWLATLDEPERLAALTALLSVYARAYHAQMNPDGFRDAHAVRAGDGGNPRLSAVGPDISAAGQTRAVGVPADLLLDDLPTRLAEAGFAAGDKALFTLLGVSWYLPVSGLDALLAGVAALSVRGTVLLLDYTDEGFRSCSVPRVQRMISMAEAAGEPVLPCLSQGALAALLERHGFSIYEHVAWQELQARCLGEEYGVRAFEHINCALAVFTG